MVSDSFYDRYGKVIVPSEDDKITSRKAVYALFINSGHILFAWPEYSLGVAELPGGGIEAGETVKKALEREISEETGIEISLIQPNNIYSHKINYFADDVNGFWKYDQQFWLFEDILEFSGREQWDTPENGKAGWLNKDSLKDVCINYPHSKAIKELLFSF